MRLQLQLWVKRLRGLCYIIFNVTQFVSALIAIFATSLGAAALAWLANQRAWIVPSLAFAAGIAVTLAVVVATYLRASPARWLLRGYRWIRAEYYYRVDENDPKHHSQTITIELESMRPGVDHFENRYLWSGKGREFEPRVQSRGHVLMGAPIQRGLWKYYFIHLGHELQVGERVTVEIFQDLYDDEGKFEPFLAKTIIEPVDHLVLRVALPRALRPAQIICSETSSAIPTDSLVQKMPGQYDDKSGEISWSIPSPIFGHRYEIRWRW